jgi:hypothetical protein
VVERARGVITSYKPRLPFKREPRWNDLRRLGNSSIARASIIVPVLGYLIIFHSDLINYLNIHTSFCENCSVSWRLYMFYFSCCFFAMGSVIYAVRCPRTIKEYAVARDYFEADKHYFCSADNLAYLFDLLDREGAEPSDPFPLRSKLASQTNVIPDQLPYLAGLMGQHFFLENRKHPWSRMAVFVSYAVGFILLGIPTVWTFFQVILRVLRG